MVISNSLTIGRHSASLLRNRENAPISLSPNTVKNRFLVAFALPKISPAARVDLIAANKKTEIWRIFPQELLNSRWLKFEGLLWSACWAWFLYDMCKHGRESLGILRLQENRPKLVSDLKETCHKFINLSGATVSMALWAERAKFFALGKYTPLLQKITFIGYFITSGFCIEKTLKALRKEKISMTTAHDPKDIIKHRYLYRSEQLDLASHISTVAWAILGIAQLCGVFIAPGVTSSVLLSSCALACISIVYSGFVSSKVNPPAIR